MDLQRLFRHLFATRWRARRHFPPELLARIEQTITEVEARHGGEVRFAVETAYELDELWAGLSPRERALQVFGLLGVWDTAEDNGVLIYVSMADRDVEIVADRGIAAHVSQAEWDAVCRLMEEHFRAGRFAEGAIAGIEGVGLLLARHFPRPGRGRDELPNQAILL
jgi:uncharacterized membrane protein